MNDGAVFERRAATRCGLLAAFGLAVAFGLGGETGGGGDFVKEKSTLVERPFDFDLRFLWDFIVAIEARDRSDLKL